jgi:hypothetical protein
MNESFKRISAEESYYVQSSAMGEMIPRIVKNYF